MQSFLIRKIQLYPGASAFIAGLITAIFSYEIHIALNKSVDSAAIASRNPASSTPKPSITDAELVTKSSQRLSEPAVMETGDLINGETRASIEGIDPRLAQLLSDKNYSALREELLEIASVAVSENDKNRLGYILNLLGQISIEEQDLFAAEVYLMESLDIFQKHGDEVGSAQVNLQLGRIHLKTRQNARVAGTAYDELQVGRWYLAMGIPGAAERYIKRSIDKNLSINRYGSAASAYESLTRLYISENNLYQAKQTAGESARMFAASGKLHRANKALDLIPEGIYPEWQLSQLKTEIDQKYQQYRNQILQIERAKDYRRLYKFLSK